MKTLNATWKKISLLSLLLGAILIALPATSCREKTPGEKLEDAGDHLKEAAKDTGTAIKEATHDAADKVKDATN